jgi:SAM-dependent methyltransferase
MEPEETARSYDRLAAHWASEAFPAQNGIAQHERAFHFTELRGKALDVGCGSSGRIIQLLFDRGFQPEGLDVSSEMIALARARQPSVTFHHADICNYDFDTAYDFISAWDSIWHVPLRGQGLVLKKLAEALNPGGVLIFTGGGLDTAGEVTNACHGQPLYHATPGIPELLEILQSSGCICRHLEYDQYPEKHIYIIAQKSPQPNEFTTISRLGMLGSVRQAGS